MSSSRDTDTDAFQKLVDEMLLSSSGEEDNDALWEQVDESSEEKDSGGFWKRVDEALMSSSGEEDNGALRIRNYEVFLSFRGEDTRHSFTSHLYVSLQKVGLSVFMDDLSLYRGHRFSYSLMRVIGKSQVFIIVFSRDYARSRRCLEELNKIMQCHKSLGQAVLPVFYDVDPSEVQHQTGGFGRGFEELLSRFSIKEDESQCWRMALHKAAGISGFVAKSFRDNHHEVINDVVEYVMHVLDKTNLFTIHPVGVESRVQDIIQLLYRQKSNDILILGIWGMGGVGKTTIAKAVYNEIGYDFEGRSFLAHIGEVWMKDNSLLHLQEQLLFDIYKKKNKKIQNIKSEKYILKKKLHRKRILLVLDDVDKLDQLKSLCPNRHWLASGSTIIITTRDLNILELFGVDHVYEMKAMDETESIELFSWYAFKQANPRGDFVTLSKKIVDYSGGLPLALGVLGSHLSNRSVIEWESVLEKLKRIPDHQVQKKLKICYDNLNDDMVKQIFLDIACYFIGMDKSDVIKRLNSYGHVVEFGTSILVQRGLVTIDDKNKLRMHDMLREMGIEIIREESFSMPDAIEMSQPQAASKIKVNADGNCECHDPYHEGVFHSTFSGNASFMLSDMSLGDPCLRVPIEMQLKLPMPAPQSIYQRRPRPSLLSYPSIGLVHPPTMPRCPNINQMPKISTLQRLNAFNLRSDEVGPSQVLVLPLDLEKTDDDEVDTANKDD